MGAKVWPTDHWGVGLRDEPGVVLGDDPFDRLGALRRALARRRLGCRRLLRARLARSRRRGLLGRVAALRRSALARRGRLLRSAAARAGAADVQTLLDRVGRTAQIADDAMRDP